MEKATPKVGDIVRVINVIHPENKHQIGKTFLVQFLHEHRESGIENGVYEGSNVDIWFSFANVEIINPANDEEYQAFKDNLNLEDFDISGFLEDISLYTSKLNPLKKE